MFNLLNMFSGGKPIKSKREFPRYDTSKNRFEVCYHDKEKVREYYFVINGFHHLVHIAKYFNSKLHTQQSDYDKIKDRCFAIAESYGIYHDFYRDTVSMSPTTIVKHNIGFYKIKMNGLISHYYILIDGLKVPIDRYKDEYDNDMRKKMRNYLETYHEIKIEFSDVFIREDLNISLDFLKNSHNINTNEASRRK